MEQPWVIVVGLAGIKHDIVHVTAALFLGFILGLHFSNTRSDAEWRCMKNISINILTFWWKYSEYNIL